ncbi:trehalose-6-phosphate hydrolase [Chryseobacterium sp. StRB126]|nr:trehalose-6-phosphate hydrolase [Chryseobacterium sp. StRB126]
MSRIKIINADNASECNKSGFLCNKTKIKYTHNMIHALSTEFPKPINKANNQIKIKLKIIEYFLNFKGIQRTIKKLKSPKIITI